MAKKIKIRKYRPPRLSASHYTRYAFEQLITGYSDEPAERSSLVRTATRLLIEEALEEEAKDVMGRGYYQHGGANGGGYRNGTRICRLKSASSVIEYGAPQITGREGGFSSGIRRHLKKRGEVAESLAMHILARGCTAREVNCSFTGEDGKPLLSRAAVKRLAERLQEDYSNFSTRELYRYKVAYLVFCPVIERRHPGKKKERVMAAWGSIETERWRYVEKGKKVLLGLMASAKEDEETVTGFFQDMRSRGLADPVMVLADGAPGITKAIEACFPDAVRQRRLVNRYRALESKVPKSVWPEFETRVKAAYQAPGRFLSRDLAKEVERDFEGKHPEAVACFLDDFDACNAYLRMPVDHRQEIENVNLFAW